MVECISTYRMRYCVELEDDSPEEWACDTVVMEEAKEFSQDWLGEQIVSHRALSNREAYAMFREDNSYLTDISDKRIMKIGITPIDHKSDE